MAARMGLTRISGIDTNSKAKIFNAESRECRETQSRLRQPAAPEDDSRLETGWKPALRLCPRPRRPAFVDAGLRADRLIDTEILVIH